MLRTVFSALACLIGIGCTSAEPPLSGSSSISPHTVVEGQPQSQSSNPMTRLRWIFNEPLSGLNSAEHYRIELRLPQDGVHLILHSHFSSFSARDGVEIKLTRKANDLHVALSTPDRPEFELGTYSNLFQVSDLHRIRIEVHDGVANGVRVWVWIEDAAPEAQRRVKLENIASASAWLDSSRTAFFSSTHGRGVRWGLEFQGVVLQTAVREAPFVH